MTIFVMRYLNNLTFFRNVCAHNERLFSHRLIQRDFPDTPLHAKMGIPKHGNQYIQGKSDYFGLVIAFRYLLPREDFLAYNYRYKTCGGYSFLYDVATKTLYAYWSSN